MKILNVEITGFGPFRDRQHVDFTRFDEEGLFLISGKTGAGKSSILDAIVFALYGSVPRYDGTPRAIRSNFCAPDEPTEVQLEFEHGGERYQIVRSPEYEAAKRRGSGTTTRPAQQQLSQLEGTTWRTLATGAREVASQITDFFPLTKDEFLQVVMLAQNDFQKFLRANSSDRQRLLATLFRTHRYRKITELLSDRATTSGKRLEELEARLIDLVGDLHNQLNSTGTSEIAEHSATKPQLHRDSNEDAHDPGNDAVDSITKQRIDGFVTIARTRFESRRTACSNAEDRHRSAAEALGAAEQLHALQQRRDEARAEHAALDADTERIATDVVARLEADQLAAPLVPMITAAERARSGYGAAKRTVETTARRLREEFDKEDGAGRTPPISLPVATEIPLSSVAAAGRELTEVLGTLRNGSDLDDRLRTLTTRESKAALEVEGADLELAELTKRVSARPAEREALATDLTTARERARGKAEADAALELVRSQVAAIARIPDCNARVHDRSREFDSAAAAVAQATETERSLNQRRWLGAAAHLAATLVTGDPCSVCGSTEHPKPSTADAEAVTDVDVEAAAAAAFSAAEHLERTRDARDRANSELQEARTASGGLDTEEAQSRLAAAKTKCDELRAAEQAIPALEHKIAELVREQTDDNGTQESLLQLRTGAQTELTEVRAELRELHTRRDDLRGEFISINARLERVTELRGACDDFVTAAGAVDLAAQRAREAESQLEAALSESQFDTETDVLGARLGDNDRRHLMAERDEHQNRRAAVERVLSESALRDAPEERIDVSPVRAAEVAARTALSEASRALGAAEQLRDSVATTAARAKTTLKELELSGAVARAERQLSSDLSGHNERRMNLEAFVLAAHLEEIIAAANVRLEAITSNRYQLELDDELAGHGRQSGLGIAVFDIYSGKSRRPSSLSGGETFLVSLALALGLADVVSAQAGGTTLDTLFIDEGFGSLDSGTLEIAMRTLDRLREGGRTVGVISHVETMQDRIPARVRVRVLADGSSAVDESPVAESASVPDLASRGTR